MARGDRGRPRPGPDSGVARQRLVLASGFIAETEPPALLRAAADGGCRGLADYQATNPGSRPLSALSEHEQDEVFVRVAVALKES